MKKLTVLLVVLLTLNSCTTDSEENQLDVLTGSWARTAIVVNTDLSQSHRYDFGHDGTIIVSLLYTDNTTAEIVGYASRSLGTYDISGDKLTLRNLETYKHTDSSRPFSNIDDLELSHTISKIIVTFSIDNTQRMLTLTYPPCGPLALCPPNYRFQKIE